jgi:Recombinase
VRAMFALFLEHESLPPVAHELEARGWSNKRWRTRSGKESGGEPFTRIGLRRLLTNVLYAGKVRYKDEVHDGEQPALVDPAVFRQAQQLLRSGERGGGGPPARNRPGALLQGLLRCVPCGVNVRFRRTAHVVIHGQLRRIARNRGHVVLPQERNKSKATTAEFAAAESFDDFAGKAALRDQIARRGDENGDGGRFGRAGHVSPSD